ncbi:MAG TPA: hypothetical protein DIT04_07300 [Dysgonomonas sp.]|nr:hypothetical protein [Dysgonomonas sp.]
MEQYILEKSIWTQEDFEVMGWHDANIYGMIIEKGKEPWQGNLIFDIDYIFEWVHPVPPQKYFSFWVAPCTLIFKEVYELRINIDQQGNTLDLFDFDGINMLSKKELDNGFTIYEWLLELHIGEIQFKSLGFEQIVRKAPVYTNSQVLSLDERGGISFSKQAFEKK